MTVTIIESELRSALSGIVTDWPIRWPNEPWPANISLSTGNLPINPDGSAMPCIEAEALFGQDDATIAAEGQRISRQLGMFKIYCLYPQGIGRGDLNTHLDEIQAGFKRKTLLLDTSQWERLTTMDPRVDNNAAAVEDGDRFVRTVTIQFEFFYRS